MTGHATNGAKNRHAARLVLRFFLYGVCAYALFALLGLAAAPTLGDPLSREETIAALTFSFPEQGREWEDVSGFALREWLYRRAYVDGTSTTGARYSEQVLKVGWPFTVVRGFLRRGGSQPPNLGVGWASEARAGQPARLLPVQPVWPGIILYGLLGTVMSAARIVRKGQKAKKVRRT